MKFHIDEIILWLKNGKIRKIKFLNNKVNVITGNSSTGKTAILSIFDYCFFSSKAKIAESKINENVEWYGVNFHINDKFYTIARKSLKEGKTSEEYFFSSVGNIPEVISTNNNEKAIKKIIETEFNIDEDVVIPYGSNKLTAGSKISLRYFLMFNTISGNIIENDSDIFFDKQGEPRYRDALPRIFDIAIGIETVENKLKKEKKTELENKMRKLEAKLDLLEKGGDSFEKEKNDLIKTAKEYSLIDSKLTYYDAIQQLQKVAESYENAKPKSSFSTEYESIQSAISLNHRKIKNLEKFKSDYSSYKQQQINISDSLKTLEYLNIIDSQLLKTSIFDDIMQEFTSQITQIKIGIKGRTPIDNQINGEIKKIKQDIDQLSKKLETTPQKIRQFSVEKDIAFFLGKVFSKMELYTKSTGNDDLDSLDNQKEKIQGQLDSLIVVDTTEQKNLTINLIEEIVSNYIDLVGDALENYINYKPVFDYKSKALRLRKPKTNFIEPVGSSSNHMFLHLFFSLAMHEISFRNGSSFVAPFLIIDQPSRPYYGDKDSDKKIISSSDSYKIQQAFNLLDSFIDERINDEGSFQMIVFEHIPKELIEANKKTYIVEEFIEGNALIPENMQE